MLQSSAEGDYEGAGCNVGKTTRHQARVQRQETYYRTTEAGRERPPTTSRAAQRQCAIASPPHGTYQGCQSCDPIEAQWESFRAIGKLLKRDQQAYGIGCGGRPGASQDE